MRSTRALPRAARVVLGSLALAIAAAPSLWPATAQSAATAYTFTQSSLAGGGFQNTVAADPRHNGVVLSGSDVAGVQRSADYGMTWASANAGYTSAAENVIASTLFDPAAPDTVYAAYGSRGPGGGGVMVSHDDGVSWTTLPPGPLFDGTDKSSLHGGNSRKRCTGRLLAVDDTTLKPTLYAASFDDGVWRYRAGSWARIVTQAQLGDARCNTAMVWAAPHTLAVSTWGRGIFVLSNIGSHLRVVHVAGSPSAVQELVALGDGAVWGAADVSGVGEFMAGGGWSTKLVAHGEDYLSIDGYVGSGGDVVYAGAADSLQVPGQSVTASINVSTDSGATWSSLPSSAAQVSRELLGPATGNPWWNFDTARIGLHAFIPTSIAVEHSATQGDDVWVSDDGIWRLLGQEGEGTWYPCDQGLGSTYLHQVAVDPATYNSSRSGQRVYVGAADWGLFSASDGFSTQQGVVATHPPGSGAVGYETVVDGLPTPPELYLTAADRSSNTMGQLYAGSSAASLTPQGLGAATGGRRPLGLGVVDSGGTVTLVVPVEASGMWTRAGPGAWTQDPSLFTKDEQPFWASVAVGSGAQATTVYAFDGQAGLYRSTQAGAPGTWQLIWTKKNSDASFLWVDEVDPTRLWVSLADGLYRLDNAATATFTSPTALIGASAPGAITQFGGQILFADLVPGMGLELLRSDSTETSFSDVADATLHQTFARTSGMAVAGDGTVYIASSGHGLLVGTPTSS